MGLSGPIPSELALLTGLTILNFRTTNMDGTLPEELYSGLSSLEQIDLTGAKFSGTISPSLGLWSHLEDFFIADNNFSGQIPEEIGTLTNLERLTLNGNAFATQSIPDSLCRLQGLITQGDLAWMLEADCAPDLTTGIPNIDCPSSCCTRCCDPATNICQDNS